MLNQLVIYVQPNQSRQLLTSESAQALKLLLVELGFIQNRNSTCANEFIACYPPGDHFFNLLSFVGCSPVVNTGAEDNRACGIMPKIEIALSDISPQPIFLYGKNTRVPKCSACAKPIADWTTQVAPAKPVTAASLNCKQCGCDTAIETINWGKYACLTQFYITINGVYPREAIPSDSFISELEQKISGKVAYCFLQIDKS